MKLIYITNNRLPTEKAHGVQIAKMCEALVGQGVDLELIYPKRRNHVKGDFFEYYDIDLPVVYSSSYAIPSSHHVIHAQAGIYSVFLDSRLRGNDKKERGNDKKKNGNDKKGIGNDKIINNTIKLTKLKCLDLVGVIPHLGFRVQSLTFALNSYRYLLKNKYQGIVYSRDVFFRSFCFLIKK